MGFHRTRRDRGRGRSRIQCRSPERTPAPSSSKFSSHPPHHRKIGRIYFIREDHKIIREDQQRRSSEKIVAEGHKIIREDNQRRSSETIIRKDCRRRPQDHLRRSSEKIISEDHKIVREDQQIRPHDHREDHLGRLSGMTI